MQSHTAESHHLTPGQGKPRPTQQVKRALATHRTAAKAQALPTKQLRAELTRDRLLSAGRALLEGGGFDDISIARIASQAGCSVGAFYFRFQHKEAYFQFLLDSIIDDIKTSTTRELTPDLVADLDLAATVRCCVAHYVRANQVHAGLIRTMLQYTVHRSESWQPMRGIAQWLINHYTALVATKRNEPVDVDLARKLSIGFHVIGGHMINDILNKSSVLGLQSPDLLFWMSEVVLHCMSADPPKGADAASFEFFASVQPNKEKSA